MRHPQYPCRDQQETFDALDDLARAVAALRRAVEGRGRAEVERACREVLRQLAAADLPGDDRAEIAAVVELLLDRVKYGLSERLRRYLLPLVAAVESQLELCSGE